jgi:hypothetical protein
VELTRANPQIWANCSFVGALHPHKSRRYPSETGSCLDQGASHRYTLADAPQTDSSRPNLSFSCTAPVTPHSAMLMLRYSWAGA